jgi:hypothetical protein
MKTINIDAAQQKAIIALAHSLYQAEENGNFSNQKELSEVLRYVDLRNDRIMNFHVPEHLVEMATGKTAKEQSEEKNIFLIVSKNTGMEVEMVKICIVLHQRQFPASWQDWDISERSKAMSAMINQATIAGETVPARIVEFYG